MFKLITLLFSFILFVSCSFSQTVFQQVYHKDSLMFSITNVDITNDHGYIMAGTVSDYQFFGGGPGDVLLIRTDSTGNILWSRRWDLANDESVFSMAIAADSTYVITGFTIGATTNSRDGFILKADDYGNLIWVKRIDHSGASNALHSVKPAKEGKYILSGRDDAGTGGMYDMYLCLADTGGNIIWGRTYGGANWDWAWWADETPDGGYIVTGETQSFGIGSNDIYLLKTDDLGNKQWSKVYGSTSFEKGLWVKQTGNNYYVVGYTQGFIPNNQDAKAFIMKTDISGNVIWFKVYKEMDTPNGVVATSDGGIVMTGSSYNLSGGFGGWDMYVIKTDSAGNVQWSHNYGSADGDGGSSAAEMPGGFLLGGSTYGFVSPQYSKIYLAKTDINGTSGCNDSSYTTTVINGTPIVLTPQDSISSGYTTYIPVVTSIGIIELDTILCYTTLTTGITGDITDKDLLQLFPNPATSSINILLNNKKYFLKSIRIFDSTGREVKQFSNVENSEMVSFNCSSLPGGIYLVLAEGRYGETQVLKFVIQGK